VSSAHRHPAEALIADPPAHSLARHFPTFYFLWKRLIFLWKCLVSFRNGLWRRRRAIGTALGAAAVALVVLWGAWEAVVGPQRDAVAAIQEARGSVTYDWEWKNGQPARPSAEPPWPGWLVKTLGPDVFGHVVAVDLAGRSADEALMTHIGSLTRLKELRLSFATLPLSGLAKLEKLTDLEILEQPYGIFSDYELAPFAGLTKLKHLLLVGPEITNKGLVHLAGMRQMAVLQLIKTNITTLEPICGLTQLKALTLQDSPVGDEGLRPLDDFTSLEWLELGGTQVTDAELAHLKGLTKLSHIYLGNTRVTDAGKAELKRIMPALNIDR
jgi:hypothetical protein